jgi:hypothetical protein
LAEDAETMTSHRRRPGFPAIAITAMALASPWATALAVDAPAGDRNEMTPPSTASPGASPPSSTLDLRPRPPVPLTASMGSPRASAPVGDRSIRIIPIKSIVEWGVENSSEALAACQRGPHAGATVSAYSAWTSRSNAQPDHCYRF